MRSGYRERDRDLRDRDRSGSRDRDEHYGRPSYDRPPYERTGLDRSGPDRYGHSSSPYGMFNPTPTVVYSHTLAVFGKISLKLVTLKTQLYSSTNIMRFGG